MFSLPAGKRVWLADFKEHGNLPSGRSPQALIYRQWYRSKAWRELRRAQLTRDHLCAMCRGMGRATQATIVDHRQPHRGDAALFFNPANLASLCKPHHDSTKARAERGRGRQPIAVGTDGWPAG